MHSHWAPPAVDVRSALISLPSTGNDAVGILSPKQVLVFEALGELQSQDQLSGFERPTATGRMGGWNGRGRMVLSSRSGRRVVCGGRGRIH